MTLRWPGCELGLVGRVSSNPRPADYEKYDLVHDVF